MWDLTRAARKANSRRRHLDTWTAAEETPQLDGGDVDGDVGGKTWNEFGRASDNENETRRAFQAESEKKNNKKLKHKQRKLNWSRGQEIERGAERGREREKKPTVQTDRRIKTSKVILRFGQQSKIKKCRHRDVTISTSAALSALPTAPPSLLLSPSPAPLLTALYKLTSCSHRLLLQGITRGNTLTFNFFFFF